MCYQRCTPIITSMHKFFMNPKGGVTKRQGGKSFISGTQVITGENVRFSLVKTPTYYTVFLLQATVHW